MSTKKTAATNLILDVKAGFVSYQGMGGVKFTDEGSQLDATLAQSDPM